MFNHEKKQFLIWRIDNTEEKNIEYCTATGKNLMKIGDFIYLFYLVRDGEAK